MMSILDFNLNQSSDSQCMSMVHCSWIMCADCRQCNDKTFSFKKDNNSKQQLEEKNILSFSVLVQPSLWCSLVKSTTLHKLTRFQSHVNRNGMYSKFKTHFKHKFKGEINFVIVQSLAFSFVHIPSSKAERHFIQFILSSESIIYVYLHSLYSVSDLVALSFSLLDLWRACLPATPMNLS